MACGHPYHDRVRGEGLPHARHELHEELGVSVSHVQADELQLGDGVQDRGQVLKVSLGRARGAGGVGQGVRLLLGEGLPLVQAVVLVDASVASMLPKKRKIRANRYRTNIR